MTQFEYSATDQIDRTLFAALWSALSQQPLDAVSLEKLADEAGLAITDLYIRYADSDAVLMAALHDLDSASLRHSAGDFADAPETPVHEKLLEGLIRRFEICAFQSADAGVHIAAQRNPVLAACLLTRLSDMVNRLLYLCGDEVSGWRRQARIYGIMVLLLRVRPVWHSDDTADLSLTLKSLDKELKRAAEWAVSFRVLDDSDLDATAHQN